MSRRPRRNAPIDPTPAEIEERTETIRRHWSDHEREKRSHYKVTGWLPPVFSGAEFNGAGREVDQGAS